MKNLLWKILLPIRFLLSFVYWLLFQLDKKRTISKVIANLKIISIGNISFGGTGKTPFVAYLAQILNSRYNITPLILMRGYKSPLENNKNQPCLIDLTGQYPEYALAQKNPGDEALLYSLLQTRAILGIGKNRYINAIQANKLKIKWAILDDGMQHHALKKDFEFIILDTRDLFGGGLIPLGKRREPLNGLKKAHLIILSKWNQSTTSQKNHALKLLQRYASGIPYLRANHELDLPYCLADDSLKRPALKEWRSKKVSAFCAIGNPASFQKTLKNDLKVVINKFHSFRDHYDFQKQDLDAIIKKSNNQFLMTEKDAVKIKSLYNNQIPDKWKKLLWVVPVRWNFYENDEKKFLKILDSITNVL